VVVTKYVADEPTASSETADLNEDALIRSLAAGRREGRDTSSEADALLELTARKNRAALDRLAR
jgi:hypothetical protein